MHRMPFNLLYSAALTCEGHHLVSFQFLIQRARQLQHHGAGNGRVRGALELPPVPLRWVVLGVVVTGEDQAPVGRRVEGGDYVGERQLAVRRFRHKRVLRHLPARSEGTQGGFDML